MRLTIFRRFLTLGTLDILEHFRHFLSLPVADPEGLEGLYAIPEHERTYIVSIK
jgi:hypothetical protein